MMLTNVTVEFTKKRFYEGKEYNKGDIIKMNAKDSKAYFNSNSIKYYIPSKNKLDFEGMTYKQLQLLCKKHNIPAVGKKEELINSLKENSNPS